MLHEDAANWATAVENTAIVTRTGPQLVPFFGIINERAEKRRLQGFSILLQPADQILGDEFRRFLGEKHIAVDEVENLHGNVLEALAAHQYNDGHIEAALAHQIYQCRRLSLKTLLAPIHYYAADRGVGLHGNFRVLQATRLHHLEAHALDRRDDLLNAHAFEILSVEGRG